MRVQHKRAAQKSTITKVVITGYADPATLQHYSSLRSAEDDQRHGGRGDRRRGEVPRRRSGGCAARAGATSRRRGARRLGLGLGRRRFSVHVGRVAEDRAREAAQLAYIVHKRGQVGRI